MGRSANGPPYPAFLQAGDFDADRSRLPPTPLLAAPIVGGNASAPTGPGADRDFHNYPRRPHSGRARSYRHFRAAPIGRYPGPPKAYRT